MFYDEVEEEKSEQNIAIAVYERAFDYYRLWVCLSGDSFYLMVSDKKRFIRRSIHTQALLDYISVLRN